MPKKYFVIELDIDVEIRIMIETANGVVVNYVVKLLIIQNNKHFEVIRFDNAHGCPHKDLLDKHGNIVRKTWYDFFDNQQGLDMAIKDIKDNYELYIERFTKWSQK